MSQGGAAGSANTSSPPPSFPRVISINGDQDQSNYSLYSYEDEHESDEISINWCMLLMRILAIVLLLAVILCFCLGGLNPKFVILGGILAGALAVVLVFSFVDCEVVKSRYRTIYIMSKMSNHGISDLSTAFLTTRPSESSSHPVPNV